VGTEPERRIEQRTGLAAPPAPFLFHPCRRWARTYWTRGGAEAILALPSVGGDHARRRWMCERADPKRITRAPAGLLPGC